jgi:TolB protein
VTNPPDRAGLARLPKGSVTVKVVNNTPESEGPPKFIIYVEGADEPQQALIPPGATKVLTFKSVADLGRRPQMVIAMYGKYRWFVPGVDVIAGRSVTAPIFPILDQGFDLFGAFRPVWRADGSRISFRNGICIISSVAATPAAQTAFEPFFAGKNPGGACSWDWGPTAALADQVIYTDNYPESNIYQMREGGTHPGTKLTSFIDIPNQHVNDMHWMPDGTGVLYSTVNLFRDAANIFRYDIATKRTTQITTLEKEFARVFSPSPDGRSIVFERCPTRDDEAGCNIWTIGMDGRGARELVKDGLRPAWGK